MKIIKILLAIFGGIVLMTGLWILGSYNNFVIANEDVDTAWSQVETQYQRQFDLVPNLVAATQGIFKQEQKVFGDIASARTHYGGTAPASNERVQALSQYESALARLLVIVENYPQLKSNETVRGLMDELAGTENRVAVERNRYNGKVREYNITIKRFPKSLLAGLFGYESRAFFDSVEDASKAPKVEL